METTRAERAKLKLKLRISRIMKNEIKISSDLLKKLLNDIEDLREELAEAHKIIKNIENHKTGNKCKETLQNRPQS